MNSKTSHFLLIIFTVLLIGPLVYIYQEHGLAELQHSQESKADGNEKKFIRQSGEGLFFITIAWFYTIIAILMVIKPFNIKIYYTLVIVTIGIVILYYLRTTTGIPVLWTGVWIKEYVVDWNDVITKILQQVLVVPASALIVRARYYRL
ncbi:MAG TPA: hypothetical protein VFG90_08275 [Nitrososphaeraceae archaeon]|nr:hypothetical protein [Nitrososphaeraceae archaeon]